MEIPDTDSALESDDVSLMSNESSTSSGSGTISRQRWIRQVQAKSQISDRERFFVNIYCSDGITMETFIIDTQMNVSTVLHLMAERSHVQCHEKWGLVEYLPELNIERCLEDHEILYESLLEWKPKSDNRIIFSQREEKYDIFRRPERYLTDCDHMPGQNEASRLTLLKTFFSSDLCKSSRAEGLLWTKSSGKTWKKQLFVLSDGILYQGTKWKKGTSKDFSVVTNVKFCRVYWANSWKKKLKAPNEFGFAFTQLDIQYQEKAISNIWYLCAEDNESRFRWTTMFRLAQVGRQLEENFCNITGHSRFLENPDNVGEDSSYTHSNVSYDHPKETFLHYQNLVMDECDSKINKCLSRGEKPPLLDSKLVFDGFENDHHHGGTICGKPNISLFRVQTSIPASLVQFSLEPLNIDSQPSPLPKIRTCDLKLSHDLHGSELTINSFPPPPEELRHLQRLQNLINLTFKHKGNQPNLDSFPSFGHPATTLPRPLSPQNIFYDDTSFSLEEQIYPLGKKSKSLSHSQNFYPMNVSTLGTEQQVYLHGIPPSMNQCNPNCSNNNDSFKISFLSGDKHSPIAPQVQYLSQTDSSTKRRITFNELVLSLDDHDETEWHPLKSDDVAPIQRDIQGCSLHKPSSMPIVPRHPHAWIDKISNGRSVPNCFQPSEIRKILFGKSEGPPPPPQRSLTTQLTSPN